MRGRAARCAAAAAPSGRGAPRRAGGGAAAYDAAAAAETLLGRWSTVGDVRAPITEPGELPVPPDVAAVFATHTAMAASPHAARLGGVVGYKMGWKGGGGGLIDAPAMHGPIFRAGVHAGGDAVPLGLHKIFCAEAEFGFTLGGEVPPRGEPYSEDEVRGMVAARHLCIELCGARHTCAGAAPLTLCADALCGAGVVIGPPLPGAADWAALAAAPVTIRAAGRVVAEGSGRENPFDAPLASLRWLVNDVCVRRGAALPAGAFVAAGHCCQLRLEGGPAPAPALHLPSARCRPGDVVRAEFAGVGAVEFEVAP